MNQNEDSGLYLGVPSPSSLWTQKGRKGSYYKSVADKDA